MDPRRNVIVGYVRLYAAALFFGFLVTTPRWTSEARFPLIILVTTAFMVERFLYNRLLAHEYTPVMDFTFFVYEFRNTPHVSILSKFVVFFSRTKSAFGYGTSDAVLYPWDF